MKQFLGHNVRIFRSSRPKVFCNSYSMFPNSPEKITFLTPDTRTYLNYCNDIKFLIRLFIFSDLTDSVFFSESLIKPKYSTILPAKYVLAFCWIYCKAKFLKHVPSMVLRHLSKLSSVAITWSVYSATVYPCILSMGE